MKAKEAVAAVKREREYQRTQWSAEHDRSHDSFGWLSVLTLQMGKLAVATFHDNAEEEAFALAKIGAVALAALEQLEVDESAFERPCKAPRRVRP